MEYANGQSIKGYELRERIGAGAFGGVYKAFQSTVGREVAIKVILPHFANHPDFIRRFEIEARLIARLEHLHITPLYDYWRDPDGAYLVMRWLKGGSLRDALKNGAFNPEAAALLLDQIASGLATAHRNQIIHRDLKPGNILLDEDGNAYLADFGIAKDITSQANMTDPDSIPGTPDYLSPEQVRSEPVTPHSDIYSLGVVLHEILAGQHPFPHTLSIVERLFKHLNELLPEITTLPDDVRDAVNAVIQKATAKDPSQRYGDALEMAAAFRAAIKSSTNGQIIEKLTLREQEILSRIIEGRSNKEIAQDLFITVETVRWYIRQIYRKLGVQSRVQAIVRARELNLIVPPGTTPANAIAISTEDFHPDNPYKGLRAFQSADHQDFYGREKLVEKLLKRMSDTPLQLSDPNPARFLAVVGPSGSGKSSLVKAGLIPAVWRGELPASEKWFVVEMLPGTHPFDELEIALTRVAANQSGSLNDQLRRDKRGLLRAANLILPNDGSELLLVVDQFEEVFTLVEDESERLQFLELLHAAASDLRSRVRVIITLRADFYDRPLHYPEFGELVRSRMETVLPLSADGLERAITAPAERVGVRFEPGLVAAIISEIHYQPGALPLLQYALTELFENRHGHLLTLEAYQVIGRTTGALAKRADEIYLSLDSAGQEAARQMFLRLVTLGEGVEDTRRRATRSELLALRDNSPRHERDSDESETHSRISPPLYAVERGQGGEDVMDELIDTYAAYRLLSLDNDPATRTPTVEVAHEAILREWEQLRNWINDSREDIKMQQQLAHLTEEWLNAGKDASYLVTGLRLEQFEKWAKESQLALTPTERAYLDVSTARRNEERAAEQERQARVKVLEQRSVRFLRVLVAVLLLATLGAFGLTAVAANQSQLAQEQSRRAEKQAQIAQARELAGYATNNLSNDAELSTLLALQAVNTTYAADGMVLPEAEEILHQAVQELRVPLRLKSASYSPSSTLWFFFTPDGKRMVYAKKINADYKGELTAVADAITGQELYMVDGSLATIYRFNDHLLTVNGTEQGFVILEWDISSLQSGKLLQSIDVPFIPDLGQYEVALDMKHLVTWSVTQGTQMWDITSGSAKEITTLLPAEVTENRINGFSPDGTRFAFLNADGNLSMLDTATWKELFRLAPAGTSIAVNQGASFTFLFTEDGNSLVTVNENETLSLWNLSTGTEQFIFAPPFQPRNISVSDDGRRLAAGTQAGETIIWDATTGQELLNLSLSRNQGFFFSPDGDRLGTLNSNGDLKIWPLIPGQELATFSVSEVNEDAGPTSIVYSPDGSRLVTASVSETPIVWDAQTGQQVFVLSGHTARVWAAAWSSDGKLIASGGEDTEVKLWNAATGEEVRTLLGHTDSIYGVAFSPDSALLASSSYDSTVRIWNATSGELMLTLEQPTQSKGVRWSPDGKRIAALTNVADDFNAHLRVWDALTGEQQLDVALGDSKTGTVVFNPDGTRIAVVLGDARLVYVLDSQTGQKLLTLAGHTSNVAGLAYSPDGERITTTGMNDDQQVILWNATTGQELLTLYNPSAGVTRAAFSPDGKHLAALSQDGLARIYTLDINDLIGLANSRLTRTFTPDECQKYLHTDTCPAGI